MTSLISSSEKQGQTLTIVPGRQGLRDRYIQDRVASNFVGHLPTFNAATVGPNGQHLDPPNLSTALETFDRGPDIDWIPSFETYKRRVDAIAQYQAHREKEVPVEFPPRVESARSWSGSDFDGEEDYVVSLSEADLREIQQALLHLKCR